MSATAIQIKATPAADELSTGYTMTMEQARAAWMRRVIGIPLDTDPKRPAISVPAYIVVNQIGLVEEDDE